MGTKGSPRRAAPAAPIVLTVIMLVLAVLAAGFMGDFSADPVVEPPSAVRAPEGAPTPSATGTPEPSPDGERLEISGDWAVGALLILGMAVLALLVRFLLRFRVQQAAEDGLLEQADLQPQDLPALAADALPAWADASDALLTEEADTSDAVIRCWLDFERLCAADGVGRTPAQTTSDFASAAAATLELPLPPLATLTRLYQRARFGRTGTGCAVPLGQDERELAITSVRELAAALPSRRTGAGAR
ncbi:DUF4129 domain-containing protein [Arthrobacter sp. B0490]|uniref:DUF4129 domain-containing protein n=1 Tax=Arthrobacter sp. B0490 TaxID=2058891 RepID=UPI000CE316EE|nr:DUF4129 domain-containing protein [Arthrobacter sp. B0490]